MLGVPAIFWTTVASTFGMVLWITVVGRGLADLLPVRLRPAAKFYLAPVLGLSALTLIGSTLGRFIPLGGSPLPLILLFGALAGCLARERNKRETLLHALRVGAFSLACGASVLGPLVVYGAFDAHNDAFTYLAHSGWLQAHAFFDTISPDAVTPLTTQIAMYQIAGFRMGASSLLALVQAIFRFQWAFAAYPPVIIVALSACCLSLGFPIAPVLRRLSRLTLWLLLALPALSFGGLVFGANFGFLPQTVAMSFACGFLFLSGVLLQRVANTRCTLLVQARIALLSAMLLSALTLAYSELLPFVALATGVVGIVVMVQSRTFWPIVLHGLAVLATNLVLLNTEIPKVYKALRLQSGAVVGTPVDWSLIGFVAHALGIHGGAWDGFQWTLPLAAIGEAILGLVLLVALGAMLFITVNSLWRLAWTAALRPASVLLSIFLIGLFYFRYGVEAPFPVGRGQSWSQFKLSDWAHPFASVFLLAAIPALLLVLRVPARPAIAALFIVGLSASSLVSVVRVGAAVQSYGQVRDLAGFYTEFRAAVQSACPEDAPVYLALADRDMKFRQLATLYLPDRQIFADWQGDDYIRAWLPEAEQRRALAAGQCVVQRQSSDQIGSDGLAVGPFIVGPVADEGRIGIQSVEGAHGYETNSQDWWHWVEREAIFGLQPLLVPDSDARSRVRFTYETRGPQTITMVIEKAEAGTYRPVGQVVIKSAGTGPAEYNQVLDIPPADMQRLRLTTDTAATPLQAPDTRLAAWRIQNLQVKPDL